MEWIRELNGWWKRRRRYAEEVTFHRQMSMSEFESMGMSRSEARRLTHRRMGARLRYRRAALRTLRADWRALLDVVPRHRIRKSPLLLPGLLATAIILMLAFNPQRQQMVESLARLVPFTASRKIIRFVPLTPPGLVPVGFAAFVHWSFTLTGINRLASSVRLRHWRVLAFGTLELIIMSLFGAVLWCTVLQSLLRTQWQTQFLQGTTLLAFAFAYAGLAFAALHLWHSDLEKRCPVCLRRFGMPEMRGKPNDLFIEPLETETICLQGHGLNVGLSTRI